MCVVLASSYEVIQVLQMIFNFRIWLVTHMRIGQWQWSIRDVATIVKNSRVSGINFLVNDLIRSCSAKWSSLAST